MANSNGYKITIATLLTIIMATVGVIWAMSAQNTQLNTIGEDVKALKPIVIDHEKKITILETKQQAILTGVEKIQKTLDAR